MTDNKNKDVKIRKAKGATYAHLGGQAATEHGQSLPGAVIVQQLSRQRLKPANPAPMVKACKLSPINRMPVVDSAGLEGLNPQ